MSTELPFDVHSKQYVAELLADLKFFWGPEICRLEYLTHLLDTGRIKDDGRNEYGAERREA